MINRVFCFVGEKDGVKYLKIDKGDVFTIWNQVFSGVKYHIENFSDEKVLMTVILIKLNLLAMIYYH